MSNKTICMDADVGEVYARDNDSEFRIVDSDYRWVRIPFTFAPRVARAMLKHLGEPVAPAVDISKPLVLPGVVAEVNDGRLEIGVQLRQTTYCNYIDRAGSALLAEYAGAFAASSEPVTKTTLHGRYSASELRSIADKLEGQP